MKPTLLFIAGVLALAGIPCQVVAAPAPKSKAAAVAAPLDPGWPREFTKDGVTLRIYQPQLDDWKDYSVLKARAAFLLTAKDGNPMPGVMEVSGLTTTNNETRTVLIRDLKTTDVRFPSLPEAEVTPMRQLLENTWTPHSMTVSLDRVAAGLEHKKAAAKPLDLKMDPPKIFVSAQPAILLMVEGKPVKAPVTGTKLEFVVNTNWDLLFDQESQAYYLLSDTVWLTSPQLEGPWSLASILPPEFKKLPKGEQWDHVKKAMPPKVERGMTVPQVYYSEQPAELIAFDGNPVWEEIPDTQLLWGKNAEGWVFESAADRQIYYLVSGRWFSAAKWEGPWKFASGDLPADFKAIPPDSPCAADVMSSVPGTEEAEDAVLLASVPQEAVVKSKEVEAKAKVVYDGGDPKFEPIKDTQMTYATNTGSDVICYENKYYLCQDAVWFIGVAATGPWTVCVDVPAVIYTIPPAYPVHRVTYVKVVAGEAPDTVVCSYTAGYFGAFVAGVATGAALVWGTGYYYPPYVAWGGPVPVYRPWPATYGCAAAYNPWTGGYAVGERVYGPYASAGRAAWYNPATGNYGRAARVSGPYGARTAAAGYNPRTDTAWATRQGNNGYAQWGTSAVRRGDDWVRAGHVTTGDAGASAWRGSEGGGRHWHTDDHSGGVAYHDGDIYAGHDGNVYRRDGAGDWSKYGHGDWESVDHRNPNNRYNPSRPGEGGGGTRNPNLPVIDPNRPGAGGGGTRNPNIPEGTRPGEGGSGTRNPNLPVIDPTRPGTGGGGTRNPNIPDGTRPGAGGSGTRFNPDAFENRAPARRAETQPGGDVTNRLSRESAGRDRADFNTQQRREMQRQMPQRQTFQPRSGGGMSDRSGGFSGSRGHFGGGGGRSGGGLRRR